MTFGVGSGCTGGASVVDGCASCEAVGDMLSSAVSARVFSGATGARRVKLEALLKLSSCRPLRATCLDATERDALSTAARSTAKSANLI